MMNLKKPQVKFTGHVISKDGLKPNPDKVKAVKNMLKPTCKRDSKSTGFHQLPGQIDTNTIWSSTTVERSDPGQHLI